MATSEQTAAAIQELKAGDNIFIANNLALDSWSLKPVLFSSGVGDTQASVRVTFEKPNGEIGLLEVGSQQPVLLSTKKVKPAHQLEAISDHVMLKNNGVAKILSVDQSTSLKNQHFIATSTSPSIELEEHLYACNEVVCADYAVQLAIAMQMEGVEEILA